MMSQRLYCIAEFQAKPGCEEELFNRLQSLEPMTLREDGCIRYRVTRQVSHSNAPGQSKFSLVFNEEWASCEAFEQHCQQAYIVDFFRSCVQDPATGLVADSCVRVFRDEFAPRG